MQLRRKKHKSSTKKQEAITIATQQQSPKESKQWSIYRSINELPLSRYMDCACDNNLTVLTKSGFPPEDELHFAWMKIQEEYSMAMGDAEFVMYFRTFKDLAILVTNYKLILHAIQLLKQIYHEGIANELNHLLKTKFDFSGDNRLELLKRCENRSKSIKINIDLKTIEF